MRHLQNKILGVVEVHMEEELKHGSQFLVGHKIVHYRKTLRF